LPAFIDLGDAALVVEVRIPPGRLDVAWRIGPVT